MNQVLRVRLTRLINGRNITLHSTLFLFFSSNCFLTHLLPFRFYCFFSSLGLHLFLMSDIFSVLPASKKNPQVVFPEHSNLLFSPFLVRYLLPIFFLNSQDAFSCCVGFPLVNSRSTRLRNPWSFGDDDRRREEKRKTESELRNRQFM
jgi:hypothetical protein